MIPFEQLLEERNEIRSDIYLQRYLKFIQHYIKNEEQTIKDKFETHHILPVSIYQDYKRNTSNLVKLPLRAHYLAHWLLAKTIGGKMWSAFQLMGRLRKHNSYMYEAAKIKQAEINRIPENRAKVSKKMKQLWEDPNYRKMQSDSHKGRPNTPEQKAKISRALKGRPKPPGFGIGCKYKDPIAAGKKISESQRGLNNSNLQPYTLYDNNHLPIITILLKRQEVLKELGYPSTLKFTTKTEPFYHNWDDKRQCDRTLAINIGRINFRGWYFEKSGPLLDS